VRSATLGLRSSASSLQYNERVHATHVHFCLWQLISNARTKERYPSRGWSFSERYPLTVLIALARPCFALAIEKLLTIARNSLRSLASVRIV
jgi:hypothetical protein